MKDIVALCAFKQLISTGTFSLTAHIIHLYDINPSFKQGFYKKVIIHTQYKSGNHAVMVKTIQRLIEICNERENGYRTATHYIQDPSIAEKFKNIAIQSKSFKGMLVAIVSSAKSDSEAHPLEDTFGDWMDFETDVTTSSTNELITFCESGEKKAIAAYEEALENMVTDSHIEVVQTQLLHIKNALEQLNDLKQNSAKEHANMAMKKQG